MRPLRSVPGGVGEEDDMWRREHDDGGVVFAGVELSILQEFCHGVEVIRVLSCRPGDVKDSNRGDLVLEGVHHILDPASECDSRVFRHEVACQSSLALVASSVSHPDNVSVVSREVEHVKDTTLPGTRNKVLVRGDLHGQS